MKKAIFIFASILFIYLLLGKTISNNVVIPNNAIRVRVIANSNSKYDQSIKNGVKTVLTNDIKELINPDDNIDIFRNKIIRNMSFFKENISNYLVSNNYNLPFNINYGLNYFPKKEFRGIKYDDGYYESLVVTLGDGMGDNWWCVLFPPLCLLEAEDSSNVEYTSLVKEMINKYF